MKVQHIQSSTNGPAFKMHFKSDKNGYLRKLWQNSIKDTFLNEQIDKAYKQHKGHVLEIIDTNEPETVYTIFNHKTGQQIDCSVGDFETLKLSKILEKVFKSKILFEEDSPAAKMYQKLTGQKPKADVSI